MNGKDAVIITAVGFTLYLVLKVKEKFDTGLDDYIARPIAYIISKLTLPPAVHINGGAVLPDGGYVSWDAVTDAGSKLDSKGIFVWRGRRFKVTQRRADGNYDTTLA